MRNKTIDKILDVISYQDLDTFERSYFCQILKEACLKVDMQDALDRAALRQEKEDPGANSMGNLADYWCTKNRRARRG